MTTPGGTDLARGYYQDVVRPLLSSRWPGLPHAAGRLGTGSDVLGVDDERSLDHDWGLRLHVLVTEELVDTVRDSLDPLLPETYQGWPTRFATTWDAAPRHRVEVITAEELVRGRLGVAVDGGLSAEDWLCLTGQSLLEVTGGEVFVDTPGRLTALRSLLRWYPDEVWRYVVASDWHQLAEDLPLLGRAGERGDDLGADLLAGRIADRVVHLAFTLSRQWPPYPKWTEALLAGLPVAGNLVPALRSLLRIRPWQQRQQALAGVLEVVRTAQVDAGLAASTAVVTEPFFARPYLSIRREVVEDLMRPVTAEALLRLPVGLGSVEQWSGATALLAHPSRRVAAARAVLRAVRQPPSS